MLSCVLWVCTSYFSTVVSKRDYLLSSPIVFSLRSAIVFCNYKNTYFMGTFTLQLCTAFLVIETEQILRQKKRTVSYNCHIPAITSSSNFLRATTVLLEWVRTSKLICLLYFILLRHKLGPYLLFYGMYTNFHYTYRQQYLCFLYNTSNNRYPFRDSNKIGQNRSII